MTMIGILSIDWLIWSSPPLTNKKRARSVAGAWGRCAPTHHPDGRVRKLYFFAVFWCLSGLCVSVREFVSEKRHRTRARNYLGACGTRGGGGGGMFVPLWVRRNCWEAAEQLMGLPTCMRVWVGLWIMVVSLVGNVCQHVSKHATT